jgi:hypothetical protein
MTILRQIKELKSEYAEMNAHILRQVITIHGCIPDALDPKKGQRLTLLPGWMIVGGLPSTPSYEPDDEYRTPEQFAGMPEDVIA